MAIGTAGYTAMLSVMALQERGPAPGAGDILVTGAAGGVGSVAVSLLADAGYRVVACTGRPAQAEFLKALGAQDILNRASLCEPGKPLQKERWADVIDCVGSHTLANALAQELNLDKLAALSFDLAFDDLPGAGADILAGKIRGRAVVDIQG